jgi:hypothetical protein
LHPKDLKKALLRFNDSKVPNEDDSEITKRLWDRAAGRIQAQYKDVLFRCCHMGPEQSVIKNALEYMHTRFLPDFRNLLGARKFWSRRHFEKLGISVSSGFQGLTDYNETTPPPYIKTCQFISNGDVCSTAIGVNIWSLLAMVSLMGGATLHPHINNDTARSTVEKILSNSPVACTPGNSFAVRSFGVEDMKNEEIIVQKHNRPEHFLRPYDQGFAASGVLPVGKAVAQFLPEDMMHAPFLERLSSFLHCNILEVPANAIECEYELVPERFYSMHIPLSHGRAYGTVFVNSAQENVEIVEFDDGDPCEGQIIPARAWIEHVRSKSYVLTPMLWRAGVCIRISGDDGSFPGCLIPFPETESQFNHSKCTYKILYSADMSTVDTFFLDTLANVIPAGEIMLLDMKVLPPPYTKNDKWLQVFSTLLGLFP